MPAPEIHIHLHFARMSVQDAQKSVQEQINAGADVEVLQDIGYKVDSQATPTEAPINCTTVDSNYAEQAELEIARALDRRTNLERVLERSEEYGNRKGHLRTSERPPSDRKPIQLRHKRARDEAEKSLKLACAVCRFAGRCGLKDDFDKWVETKPYKANGSVPKHFRPQVATETRDEFRGLLKLNPEIHCNPASATRKNKAP